MHKYTSELRADELGNIHSFLVECVTHIWWNTKVEHLSFLRSCGIGGRATCCHQYIFLQIIPFFTFCITLKWSQKTRKRIKK
jgi:hypothetical protein